VTLNTKTISIHKNNLRAEFIPPFFIARINTRAGSKIYFAIIKKCFCPRKFRVYRETFEWRIRQRSRARAAVQRAENGGELLYYEKNINYNGNFIMYGRRGRRSRAYKTTVKIP